jgi:succinate dehydrogenase hydrophobic anchor subunit
VIPRRHLPRLPIASRVTALALAVLVVVLGVLAFAPAAHEHLHGDDHGHGEHSCAIVLFAQGITTAATALALVAGFHRLASVVVEPQWLWVPISPRRLPPACGPPAD